VANPVPADSLINRWRAHVLAATLIGYERSVEVDARGAVLGVDHQACFAARVALERLGFEGVADLDRHSRFRLPHSRPAGERADR
jgi:hypothetical protein